MKLPTYVERTGADVDMVRKGMGGDNPDWQAFLFWQGYRGSVSLRTKALIHTAKEHEYDFRILQMVGYQRKIKT